MCFASGCSTCAVEIVGRGREWFSAPLNDLLRPGVLRIRARIVLLRSSSSSPRPLSLHTLLGPFPSIRASCLAPDGSLSPSIASRASFSRRRPSASLGEASTANTAYAARLPRSPEPPAITAATQRAAGHLESGIAVSSLPPGWNRDRGVGKPWRNHPADAADKVKPCNRGARLAGVLRRRLSRCYAGMPTAGGSNLAGSATAPRNGIRVFHGDVRGMAGCAVTLTLTLTLTLRGRARVTVARNADEGRAWYSAARGAQLGASSISIQERGLPGSRERRGTQQGHTFRASRARVPRFDGRLRRARCHQTQQPGSSSGWRPRHRSVGG